MEKVIIFKISAEDKEKAEIEAKRLGLSVGAFIRLLLQNWSDGIKFEKDK